MPKFDLMKSIRAVSPISSFEFDELEVSLVSDSRPNIGIKSPIRTTKGKYHWSPGAGWKKGEAEEEKERIDTEMRSRSRTEMN